jgi:formamidopyrimidine-DNA glycosylase
MLNHLNVEFKLGSEYLYFTDMLSFGTLKLESLEELDKKLKSIGPEIIDSKTTSFDVFKQRINSQRDKPIGIVLMNQKLISGIGNYLRAEGLWLAKISPHRLVKNINDKLLKKIYDCLIQLVWADYKYDYAVSHGIINKKSKFAFDYGRTFFVYMEEEDIYGNKVKVDELFEGSQKRFIYWVPKLQK